jgi:membrane protease YdiL (CAAX protease family)
MLYWFSTPRAFTWFVNNEFDWLKNLPDYTHLLTVIYFSILIIWIVKTAFEAFKTKRINIPKTALITGTFLSWYFGIVYFNNDLLFTFLNVVSHGIPYIALIYIREIHQKENNQLNRMQVFKSFSGVFLFVGIILGFAFVEEFLWETLVWNEHFSLNVMLSEKWFQFLVPLLVVPQLTHYLLDGFIWRKPKKVS